ncbi:MAG TPA: hypothetical protein VMW24_21440 [Sedimentisphaerales bacterium]|nr:hypothetical protein [Sedimentisphaerales bacterium]
MTNAEKIRRGEQAAWLLEQPVFREAMDRCAIFCQACWAATTPDDPVSREIAYHQFRSIGQIESMLNNFVTDGNNTKREENGNK